MLKKILILTMIAGLTGCATHRQSNELAGAAVGGIIGNAVGGRGGAAVGAVLGAAVGGSQPTQPETRIIRERQIIQFSEVEACRPRYHSMIEQCDEKWRRDPNFSQSLRNACVNEAKWRYQNCARDYRTN